MTFQWEGFFFLLQTSWAACIRKTILHSIFLSFLSKDSRLYFKGEEEEERKEVSEFESLQLPSFFPSHSEVCGRAVDTKITVQFLLHRGITKPLANTSYQQLNITNTYIFIYLSILLKQKPRNLFRRHTRCFAMLTSRLGKQRKVSAAYCLVWLPPPLIVLVKLSCRFHPLSVIINCRDVTGCYFPAVLVLSLSLLIHIPCLCLCGWCCQYIQMLCCFIYA